MGGGGNREGLRGVCVWGGGGVNREGSGRTKGGVCVWRWGKQGRTKGCVCVEGGG